MRIIAWDIGSTIGWAEGCDGRLQSFGSIAFEGSRAQKLAKLYGVVRHQAERACFDAFAIERLITRGMAASRMLWGMAGIVEAAAMVGGVPCVDMETSTIRKHVFGSSVMVKDRVGKSKTQLKGETKAAIIDRVRERMAFRKDSWDGFGADCASDLARVDEHCADAIALFWYACDNIEITKPISI